ncbi:MAG: rRNA adenine N(6)-methyltransferase family protein [Candidatus Saccharibacteria bacterium]|nr:rRNA adenine N(6)-methyltransferase family protein [Candidatus Saccharibacteria bacterium]
MRKYQLSQHFLRSPKLAGFLIGHSNIKRRDVVIDIGAGSGVITSALARRCKQVIAVEPDAETAALLRKNTKRCDNVMIVEKDFLEMELPDGPYKIFANPPFHLSSAILHKLDEAKNPPDAIYLILQKQFALKLLNNDRHYTSQLGKQLYVQYAPRIRLPLRPNYFTPPPAVPTVLLELKKRGQ